MTKEHILLEEKVIELYEQVAVGAITPNEARKSFMQLFAEKVKEIIGEDEDKEEFYKENILGRIDVDMDRTFLALAERNLLRFKQRQRLQELLGETK